MKIRYKVVSLSLFFTAFLLSFSSYYLEYYLELIPCPLCIMQRVCLFILTLIYFISYFSKNWSYRFVMMVTAICFSLSGIFFSSRQVWLQYFASSSASCGPGFNFMLSYMPFKQIMYALFWGSGDCTKVDTTILGASLASWALLSFLFFSVVNFLMLLSLSRNFNSVKK